MSDKIYIIDEQDVQIQVYGADSEVTVVGENDSLAIVEVTIIGAESGGPSIVEVFEIGPQGPRGLDGTAQIPNLVVTSSGQINFYSIQNAPFYPIVSGSLFGTTSSFAFFGTFSSSILPWSSSFDLGSVESPWKNIFVSNSIFIGDSKITTSSFGFDDYIIKRVTNTQQIMNIKSGSVSMSFNDIGIITIPDFQTLPIVSRGGLIISGSDFFIGV